MKLSRISITLLGASLLCCASALARNSDKGSLNFTESITVAGHQLTPGQYRVEWNGTGANVELTFVQDGQTVATAPAQEVLQKSKFDQDGYGFTKQKDGRDLLTEVFFHGKDYEFRIEQKSNASTSTAASSHVKS